MRPALAVAICTRNRAHVLPGVLDDLAAQGGASGLPWELLIIDNGSTDNTRAVADGFAKKLPLRVISEPQAGLSVARNRAMRSTRADLLVFTDDDVRLRSGWLEAWARAAGERSESGWFGGPVLPRWDGSKPRWLKDESLAFLDGVLVRHSVPGGARAYRIDDPPPVGANFGVRPALIETVGPFREDLGHQGSERRLGEETDWLQRARVAGERGWYVADAVAEHPVDWARLRLRALYRHGVASGVALVRMHPGSGSGSRLRAVWALARGARQWLMGRGDRFRQCVVNAGIEAGLRQEHLVRRASRGEAGA